MKDLIESANIAARKVFVNQNELEKLTSEIESTEKILEQKQYALKELQADKDHMQQAVSRRKAEWEELLKTLKDAFARQDRFKGATSEEVTTAFNDEILPNLDFIE